MRESTGFKRPGEAELKEMLDDAQYGIMVNNETEAPFTSEYLNNEREGIYVDAATGEPLFTTFDQYDSSCGWPSFTRPINMKCIVQEPDITHGMVRTEVRSCAGNFHLGHVFEDGPKERGGLRYCINGGSIRFIPTEDMDNEGYSYLNAYMNARRREG